MPIAKARGARFKLNYNSLVPNTDFDLRVARNVLKDIGARFGMSSLDYLMRIQVERLAFFDRKPIAAKVERGD